MESNEVFPNSDPLLNNGSDNVIGGVTDPLVLDRGIGISTNNVLKTPVGTTSADLSITSPVQSSILEAGLLSTLPLDTQVPSSNSFASKLSLEQNLGGVASLNKDFLTGSTVKDVLVGSKAFDPLMSGESGSIASISRLANEPDAVPSSDTNSIFSLAPNNVGLDNTNQPVINEVASTSSGVNGIVDRLNDNPQTWDILEALRTEALARWASLGIEQADLLRLNTILI